MATFVASGIDIVTGGATGGASDVTAICAGGTNVGWGTCGNVPACGALAVGSPAPNPNKSSFLLSNLAISPFNMESVSVISVGVFVRSL